MAPSDQFDSQFVEENFRLHQEHLLRYLTGLLGDGHLASDALQITFTKLIQTPPKTDTNVRAWLFKVAYNQAMEIRRRQKIDHRAKNRIKDENSGESGISGIYDGDCDPEQVERIKAAIKQLNPHQQDVVRLRIYEDLKFAEIAEKLNVPLGTVLTRMRSAIQKLQQTLRDPDE